MSSANTYLQEIKNQESDISQLYRFPLRKIIGAITCWPECWLSWERPTGDLPKEPEKRLEWLWQKVLINRAKMLAMIGPNGLEIYYRLYKSRTIYPDGTYSQDAINRLTAILSKGEK